MFFISEMAIYGSSFIACSFVFFLSCFLQGACCSSTTKWSERKREPEVRKTVQIVCDRLAKGEARKINLAIGMVEVYEIEVVRKSIEDAQGICALKMIKTYTLDENDDEDAVKNFEAAQQLAIVEMKHHLYDTVAHTSIGTIQLHSLNSETYFDKNSGEYVNRADQWTREKATRARDVERNERYVVSAYFDSDAESLKRKFNTDNAGAKMHVSEQDVKDTVRRHTIPKFKGSYMDKLHGVIGGDPTQILSWFLKIFEGRNCGYVMLQSIVIIALFAAIFTALLTVSGSAFGLLIGVVIGTVYWLVYSGLCSVLIMMMMVIFMIVSNMGVLHHDNRLSRFASFWMFFYVLIVADACLTIFSSNNVVVVIGNAILVVAMSLGILSIDSKMLKKIGVDEVSIVGVLVFDIMVMLTAYYAVVEEARYIKHLQQAVMMETGFAAGLVSTLVYWLYYSVEVKKQVLMSFGAWYRASIENIALHENWQDKYSRAQMEELTDAMLETRVNQTLYLALAAWLLVGSAVAWSIGCLERFEVKRAPRKDGSQNMNNFVIYDLGRGLQILFSPFTLHYGTRNTALVIFSVANIFKLLVIVSFQPTLWVTYATCTVLGRILQMIGETPYRDARKQIRVVHMEAALAKLRNGSVDKECDGEIDRERIANEIYIQEVADKGYSSDEMAETKAKLVSYFQHALPWKNQEPESRKTSVRDALNIEKALGSQATLIIQEGERKYSGRCSFLAENCIITVGHNVQKFVNESKASALANSRAFSPILHIRNLDVDGQMRTHKMDIHNMVWAEHETGNYDSVTLIETKQRLSSKQVAEIKPIDMTNKKESFFMINQDGHMVMLREHRYDRENNVLIHMGNTRAGDSGSGVFNSEGHLVGVHFGADKALSANVAVCLPEVRRLMEYMIPVTLSDGTIISLTQPADRDSSKAPVKTGANNNARGSASTSRGGANTGKARGQNDGRGGYRGRGGRGGYNNGGFNGPSTSSYTGNGGGNEAPSLFANYFKNDEAIRMLSFPDGKQATEQDAEIDKRARMFGAISKNAEAVDVTEASA